MEKCKDVHVWILSYWDTEEDETLIKSAFSTKEKAIARKKKVAMEWIKEYDYTLEEALKEIIVTKKKLL